MREFAETPLSFRVKAGVRERADRLAEAEGDCAAAVLRRALVIGLDRIAREQSLRAAELPGVSVGEDQW